MLHLNQTIYGAKHLCRTFLMTACQHACEQASQPHQLCVRQFSPQLGIDPKTSFLRLKWYLRTNVRVGLSSSHQVFCVCIYVYKKTRSTSTSTALCEPIIIAATSHQYRHMAVTSKSNLHHSTKHIYGGGALAQQLYSQADVDQLESSSIALQLGIVAHDTRLIDTVAAALKNPKLLLCIYSTRAHSTSIYVHV